MKWDILKGQFGRVLADPWDRKALKLVSVNSAGVFATGTTEDIREVRVLAAQTLTSLIQNHPMGGASLAEGVLEAILDVGAVMEETKAQKIFEDDTEALESPHIVEAGHGG